MVYYTSIDDIYTDGVLIQNFYGVFTSSTKNDEEQGSRRASHLNRYPHYIHITKQIRGNGSVRVKP